MSHSFNCLPAFRHFIAATASKGGTASNNACGEMSQLAVDVVVLPYKTDEQCAAFSLNFSQEEESISHSEAGCLCG